LIFVTIVVTGQTLDTGTGSDSYLFFVHGHDRYFSCTKTPEILYVTDFGKTG
jgi:hypothetical protein